ncbi:MAG TPA: fimbria/pilus periplasmic chaperone [Usitatibacteraceae bacterium]|nr:fimbria/pilus periplasmic chaperone [Usitatibacteraceae bacterium]
MLKGLLAAIGTVSAVSAQAGNFSVTPVRIFMAPQDRAIAVTLTNEGADELLMQADVYLWKQKPGGEDDLTMSEDLFLSPPIIKLAPKARQVVRLAMVKPPKSGPQQTYRLIIREVPEVKTEDKKVQVQIALAFSLPVFITPPNAQRQVACSLARSSAEEAKASCENSGTAYAQIREFALTSAAGDKLAARDAGGYILPGISRTFELKAASGKLPSGKAKLTATFDDGASQTFDVTLAD